jgi:Transposase DDE domain group 1
VASTGGRARHTFRASTSLPSCRQARNIAPGRSDPPEHLKPDFPGKFSSGEAKEPPLRPTFDRRIKLEFYGAKITSDGGLLAYRDLDEALGLTDIAITKLLDGRRGKNTRHKLSGLFRQAVFGRLAGYEDVNDAERLARDPAMRAIVGREGYGGSHPLDAKLVQTGRERGHDNAANPLGRRRLFGCGGRI